MRFSSRCHWSGDVGGGNDSAVRHDPFWEPLFSSFLFFKRRKSRRMNEMDAKERNWVSFVFAFELQSAAGNRLTRKEMRGGDTSWPACTQEHENTHSQTRSKRLPWQQTRRTNCCYWITHVRAHILRHTLPFTLHFFPFSLSFHGFVLFVFCNTKGIWEYMNKYRSDTYVFFFFFFFCCFCLAAGFERTIPSFPRYTVTGSDDQGEHHMRIENATLEDDAEYQCQVGPKGLAKPIRADAQLTVLSKSMFM